MLKKYQNLKSQILFQNIIIALTLLLFTITESKAQYFNSDYFAPIKISGQSRTNNSFFYASYGIYSNVTMDNLDDLTTTNEKELALVWFKNNKPGNKGGFELMFKYNNKQIKQSEVGIFGFDYFDMPWKDYTLKYSSIGRRGVALSISGMRSIIDQSYGLWGFGAEMTVGGHPHLTEKKDKWPLSWSLGYNAAIQQKPIDASSEEWKDYIEYERSVFSLVDLYTKVSLQHFTYKKRLGWYFRIDVGANLQLYDIWVSDGKLYNDELQFRAGLATGLMF